jgi:hypothetical protein
MYRAEKAVGHNVWGPDSTNYARSPEPQFGVSRYVGDTASARKCIQYVKSHRKHYQLRWDGWKGDFNFWEPNEYWLLELNQRYPDSDEAHEIAFDFDFSRFIRLYDMDPEAKGMSCEQLIKHRVKQNAASYKGAYTKDDFKKWVPECQKVRDQFEAGRQKLIQKYGTTPYTKKLRDIDITTIVVSHSLC